METTSRWADYLCTLATPSLAPQMVFPSVSTDVHVRLQHPSLSPGPRASEVVLIPAPIFPG